MNTHTPNSDALLAAILDPQLAAADLPAKTGLSLRELARWFRANADLIAEVREFLTARAALVSSRLHLSSLGALDRVVRDCPDLERVRKAASTILRSIKAPIAPTPPASCTRAPDKPAPDNRACVNTAPPDLPAPSVSASRPNESSAARSPLASLLSILATSHTPKTFDPADPLPPSRPPSRAIARILAARGEPRALAC